jgi:asparagine synthase (glutamine-hydrolysing)
VTAIYGLTHWSDRDVDADADRMGTVLARYGRDAHEIWRGGTIALGARHTFLLDEDRFVAPIHARDRRYAVVADVHLTERAELERELGHSGGSAAALSDAMLVADALEHWGEGAFDRLYGWFAIAAWDTQDQRLLLARDFIGKRPLYYLRAEDGTLAFASMPDALHALGIVPRAADEDQYLRLFRRAPLSPDRTPMAGISRIMPGYYGVFTAQGATTHAYWKPDLTPLRRQTQRDYETQMLTRLDAAVTATLRGAGDEIAAHLSGGFDSTTVVVTAARLLADTPKRIVAYTAAPHHTPQTYQTHHFSDESALAAETAAMYPNVEHVVIRSDAPTLAALDRTVDLYPEPIPNLCNMVWVDAINAAVQRRGIRVLLEGTMGNLSISASGVAALPSLARRGRLLAWARLGRGLVRSGWMRWPGVGWNTIGPLLPVSLWKRVMRARGIVMPSVATAIPLLPETLARVEARIAAENPTIDPAHAADLSDAMRYGTDPVGANLRMVAGNEDGSFFKAMLAEFRIDVRDPLADRRLVEWALRVPVERWAWGGEPRAILRGAMRGKAPPSVLDTRLRGYQGADWPVALVASRDRLRDEIDRMKMFDQTAGTMDVDRLQKLVDDMPPADSPLWTDIAYEIAYRENLLHAVALASHMRRTAGSNY